MRLAGAEPSPKRWDMRKGVMRTYIPAVEKVLCCSTDVVNKLTSARVVPPTWSMHSPGLLQGTLSTFLLFQQRGCNGFTGVSTQFFGQNEANSCLFPVVANKHNVTRTNGQG